MSRCARCASCAKSSLIAAEDTRRTARLLQHYSISTPHDEPARAQRSGENAARSSTGCAAANPIALVSDAGTPVVSDPGARLVAAAHAAGVRVEPIPGPSAAMAALSRPQAWAATGFCSSAFRPLESKARKAWLERLAAEPRPVVLYEAPHRIQATLEDLLTAVRRPSGGARPRTDQGARRIGR